MEPENIATNLRLLADKQKREAAFYEAAASLQEQGYQSDQTKITTEVQKVRDELTVRAVNAETLAATLQTELDALKNPVVEEIKP